MVKEQWSYMRDSQLWSSHQRIVSLCLLFLNEISIEIHPRMEARPRIFIKHKR